MNVTLPLTDKKISLRSGNGKEAPNRSAEMARVDAEGLAAELRAAIRGEVRFDSGSRALYTTDASNYRQVPIGVVIPKDVGDIEMAIALARQYGAPLLPRGGGTSLAGQSCNVAVVLDMSKYLRNVLTLDLDNRRATVQPGVIPDVLNSQVVPHNLIYCSYPATHGWCTIGGNLGNNSCGVHSVMGGRTADNTHELDILTYDGLRLRVGPTSDEELARIIGEGGRRGEIYRRLRDLRDRYADEIRRRYPDIPRRVSGYNLDELLPENGFNVARALVGSEGTCVTILEATVRLVPNPPKRALLVLGYPDVFRAGDHVPEILTMQPTGLEGMDGMLVDNMRAKGLNLKYLPLLPEGNGWLLAEFGGDTQDEANARAKEVMKALERRGDAPSMELLGDAHHQEQIWEVREAGLGATARVPGMKETWEGWEDSAVPPDRLGEYLRKLHDLYEKYDYHAALYGHFGQGVIHTRIDFDLRTAEGIGTYRSFIDEASDLVLSLGGSLSGEHGDGQARAELLSKMYGDELVQAFREFKAIWDPEGKMNPGKVVDSYRITENLRLGTDYNPLPVKTHFHFPDDGSFANATLRCVGVGKCRRTEGGTMCPSFMVTREEQHTTRGRARALFEMLNGAELPRRWKSDAVKETLDLCLECKGCKGDCPVNVDIATYKAEFLSHYYEGRLRPLAAYAFGIITYWARLASRVPWAANFVTQTPGSRDLAKLVTGIAPERQIPPFAAQSFKSWFAQRERRNAGSPQILLWPDTFNNFFLPEAAQATVEVLEAAGFEVIVPQRDLCCGRTTHSFGMLDTGKRWLRDILTTLQPQIAAGVPMVVLEPSCLSIFRDEMINLFPADEDAQRLSRQVYLLSEFLEQKAPDFELPQLHRKALVHGHCHHKSLFGMEAEENILRRMEIDYSLPDTGCCGMAGAFGFEKEKYPISVAAGERVLLPAVRDAGPDTLIIAGGFSCREQVSQLTDRRPLHLAEVIKLALDEGPNGPAGSYPERNYAGEIRREEEVRIYRERGPVIAAAALATGVLLAGGAAYLARKVRG